MNEIKQDMEYTKLFGGDKSIEIQKNVIEQQKLTAIVSKRNKIRNYKMIIHSNDHLK